MERPGNIPGGETTQPEALSYMYGRETTSQTGKQQKVPVRKTNLVRRITGDLEWSLKRRDVVRRNWCGVFFNVRSGGIRVERRTVSRGDGGSILPAAVSKRRIPFTSH